MGPQGRAPYESHQLSYSAKQENNFSKKKQTTNLLNSFLQCYSVLHASFPAFRASDAATRNLRYNSKWFSHKSLGNQTSSIVQLTPSSTFTTAASCNMYHLPDRPGYPTQLQTMPMQMQMPMSMQAPQIPIRHESYSGGFAQHQMAPFRISVPHSHGFFPPPSVRVPTPHLAPSLANKKVSQYRGVCRERSRWRAQISWNKKRFFLGAYDTEKEAAEGE